MFCGGRTTLNFSKKRGQWENSTQSCYYTKDDQGHIEGFSYRERIIFYCESVESHVFNHHSFSNTTNSHQSALREVVKPLIWIDVYSMNDENPKNWEWKTAQNADKFLSKKDYEKLVKNLEEKEKASKEAYNAQQREKAARRKLENLDYNSIKGLQKAIDKIKQEKIFVRIETFKIAMKNDECQNYLIENLEEKNFSFSRYSHDTKEHYQLIKKLAKKYPNFKEYMKEFKFEEYENLNTLGSIQENEEAAA